MNSHNTDENMVHWREVQGARARPWKSIDPELGQIGDIHLWRKGKRVSPPKEMLICWKNEEVNKQGNTCVGCLGQLCSVVDCCYFADTHKNSLPIVQKTSFCKWLWESDLIFHHQTWNQKSSLPQQQGAGRQPSLEQSDGYYVRVSTLRMAEHTATSESQ